MSMMLLVSLDNMYIYIKAAAAGTGRRFEGDGRKRLSVNVGGTRLGYHLPSPLNKT